LHITRTQIILNEIMKNETLTPFRWEGIY